MKSALKIASFANFSFGDEHYLYVEVTAYGWVIHAYARFDALNEVTPIRHKHWLLTHRQQRLAHLDRVAYIMHATGHES